MRKSSVMLALVTALACKGADGATGPQGPAGPSGAQGVAGPIGPAGPGNRITFAGPVAANGVAFADLPVAAGTMAAPPVFGCYLLFTVGGSPAWFQTGDPFAGTGATCALGATPGASTLRVVLAGATAGQSAAIIVVY